MKVVMDFDQTELIPVAKGRGVKTFNKWFEELKNELSKIPNVRKIGISHADGLELANGFKEGLQTKFPEMDIPVLHTNSVLLLLILEKMPLRLCTTRIKRLD